ncbi:hypothetical protein LX36DRAFT_438935 [Colletotrichum falcatum]|nr:hypothetical protein LX36DRAFT_438935 [Colletotrichum falcatum]
MAISYSKTNDEEVSIGGRHAGCVNEEDDNDVGFDGGGFVHDISSLSLDEQQRERERERERDGWAQGPRTGKAYTFRGGSTAQYQSERCWPVALAHPPISFFQAPAQTNVLLQQVGQAGSRPARHTVFLAAPNCDLRGCRSQWACARCRSPMDEEEEEEEDDDDDDAWRRTKLGRYVV